MKIHVDRDLCIGAAQCLGVAPEVFQLDEEMKAVVIDPDGTDPMTVESAAQACPTQAILLTDEESGRQIWP